MQLTQPHKITCGFFFRILQAVRESRNRLSQLPPLNLKHGFLQNKMGASGYVGRFRVDESVLVKRNDKAGGG